MCSAVRPHPPALVVISPLLLADDFARHVTYDELAALSERPLHEGRAVLCSAVPDGLDALRQALDDARMDALYRELTLFVRRNLRGTDAVALHRGELIIMLDASPVDAEAVTNRLLAAARAHVFSGGASDRSLRLTLSVGLSRASVNGHGWQELIDAARQARERAGRDAAGSAFPARTSALDVARFVGRAEQLARGTDYLDDMIRGVGRVVAVIGETGIGTTALVRALEPEVRMRGGSLVVAVCRSHTRASPYALWSEVLRGVRRLPVKHTRLWRELASLDATLERAVEDVPRGRSKIRLLEELADYLRLAAQQRPLVLQLEELQWVDAASWDALEYLIPQLESERVLLALSFRTGEAYDDALERWARLASRPRHHELRLTRLTRDDVKRWLEGVMRGAEVGRDLLAYAYRQSEGNPLLLHHLLRDLEEGGQLALEDGRWRWTPPASDTPGPAPIETLLARRIERLGDDAGVVLEAAAVLDCESDDELLAAVSALPVERVKAAVRELSAAGLLVPTFERVRGALNIAHAEVARTARDRIGDERCRELHLRSARALSTSNAATATEVASHFEEAGAGPEAHEYALRAADAALALYENVAASSLLAAAERTAPSETALAEVRVRMASLAEIAGRYEDAEALCDLALEWYASQGDRLRALRVKRTRTLVRMLRGQSAHDTLAGLLALEEEASDVHADTERAAILLLISQTHWRLGDPSAARRVAEECVAIAERIGDPPLIADSCNRLAITIQLEDAPKARTLFNRALALSSDMGDTVRRVRCLNNLGILELIENNWGEARAALQLAMDEARTAGLTELWGRAALNSGVLAARVGEYDAAATFLGQSLELCAAVQNSELQLYATYNLAHLERDRGRPSEAGETYELVMALAERIGQAEVEQGARAGLGLCQLLAGDVELARRAADEVAPFLATRADWFQGRELGEALTLRFALLDGRSDDAVEKFRRALALAHPSDVYGAAWLTAEFGDDIRPLDPELVAEAVRRYASRPEVLGNPKIKERFTVLLLDTEATIDRISG